MTGKTRGVRGYQQPGRLAATEPGRDDREDQTFLNGLLANMQAATQPGRDDREDDLVHAART